MTEDTTDEPKEKGIGIFAGLIVGISTIVLVGTLIGLMYLVFVPYIDENRVITITDKCQSDTDYNYYIFDGSGNRYLVGGTSYERLNVGSTYRIHIIQYRFDEIPRTYEIMTMEEYTHSCEARGLC